MFSLWPEEDSRPVNQAQTRSEPKMSNYLKLDFARYTNPNFPITSFRQISWIYGLIEHI